MATAPKTTDANKATAVKWGTEDVQVLEGFDLVDKATLVDKPFLITGARMVMTKGGEDREPVEMMQVECEIDPRTHQKVVFQDSSKAGVKQEIEALLEKVHSWKGDLDTWYDFRVLCPQGLRVSPWKRDLGGGKTADVFSYYLTKANNGRA